MTGGISPYAQNKKKKKEMRSTILVLFTIGLVVFTPALIIGLSPGKNEMKAEIFQEKIFLDKKEEKPKIYQPCDGMKAYKKGWKDNTLQQLAFEVSGCNKNFLYALECENGEWNTERRHEWSAPMNTNGIDWGLCGINDFWHPEIIQDENFLDPKFQVKKCFELYKEGRLNCTKKPNKMARAAKNIFFKK